MRTSASLVALVALSGPALADYESEYDPIDGLGKCTSVDTGTAEKLRTVIAASTEMVTICVECDDVRPRRRDIATLTLQPFNGGALDTVLVDGAWIDLAQTFVKLDAKKLDPLQTNQYRGYSTAPFQNLALLVHCPVNGPVLRGLQEDVPAPIPVVTTTVETVVERDHHPNPILLLSLGALGGAGVLIAIRKLIAL